MTETIIDRLKVLPDGNGKPLVRFKLAAAPDIQWLLKTEVDVRNHVKRFCNDQAHPEFIVAGPPTFQAVLKLRAETARHGRPPSRSAMQAICPTIKLTCKKVQHHLTNEPGVMVTCSDKDLNEVARWRREAPFRNSINPVYWSPN